MPDLTNLNHLGDDAFRAELLRCCGSTRWTGSMLRERPFRDREHLFEAASRHWRALDRADWLEAFAHHPRIGEVKAVPAAAQATAAWAANEQAGARSASNDVKAALAEGNREYEARFNHIYLVCATGRSADEMLAILRSRIGNDPAAELAIAAGEQEKITRLRLEKLLSAP